MIEPNMSPESDPPSGPHRGRISWTAVLGFGTLGLLWPLLRLVGAESLVGGLGTALIAFLATFVVWVIGAGFGDVPRPIATLTLSGLVYGGLLAVSGALMGVWPDYGLGLAVVASVIELGRAAGFGALTGLIASAVQKARRR